MANTVVKDLMLKRGYDPSKKEDCEAVLNGAAALKGEFTNGATNLVEQYGEKSASSKVNWFMSTYVEMTAGSVSMKDKITASIVEFLGGTDADLQELNAMTKIITGLKKASTEKLTAEQKDAIVQQAYDSRLAKVEDMRREAEEKAAKKAAAPKRVKKADAKTLDQLNEGASPAAEESVDDILDEITG